MYIYMMIEPYEGKKRTKKSQILESMRSLGFGVNIFERKRGKQLMNENII